VRGPLVALNGLRGLSGRGVQSCTLLVGCISRLGTQEAAERRYLCSYVNRRWKFRQTESMLFLNSPVSSSRPCAAQRFGPQRFGFQGSECRNFVMLSGLVFVAAVIGLLVCRPCMVLSQACCFLSAVRHRRIWAAWLYAVVLGSRPDHTGSPLSRAAVLCSGVVTLLLTPGERLDPLRMLAHAACCWHPARCLV